MAVLAIDQGTTGTRSVLYGAQGEVIADSYREFRQIYPRQGWVEHDPEEIWRTVVDTAGGIMEAYPSRDVTSVGITNQRETTVVWDRRSGEPVYNAIVWQCRRTSDICRRYREEVRIIATKTGLPVDPYFSATKIRWILENISVGKIDDLLFGTIDTWLLWKLTGGKVHATDFTNASRTLLYDITEKEWDDDLLRLFGIPRRMLPEVKRPMDDYGVVETIDGLRGVPVTGVAGDQQAALFGQCCFDAGDVKNTYGTGCFMVMNTGGRLIRSKNGLLSTLAVDATGQSCYALEGSIFIGGAVVQWLRDELRMIGHAAESEALALEAASNAGVYIVPAFTGLGAPHWQMDARGTIVGLTRGANRNHIVRAALESIAYQSHDVFCSMTADSGVSPRAMIVDGGAVENNFLMQFQADILRVPVHRPVNTESTSLGAAFLAGLRSGVWSSTDDLRALCGVERSYEPAMDARRREECLLGWKQALFKTLAV
ncbi:glycerol kinase [Prosthecochloris sp. GSB1]|uniref:glycerol kinase GlpK n=1 Tax=Prosthecochloris sp. GSB1 TaxID=281093 RepID=UPI000B8D0ABC|nr:glycerol kinase GlpK [Prosthecochloris sp. GSB1]ASQ90153.1 glycerol kinase [Prosthecochloris sp. GSB1]